MTESACRRDHRHIEGGGDSTVDQTVVDQIDTLHNAEGPVEDPDIHEVDFGAWRSTTARTSRPIDALAVRRRVLSRAGRAYDGREEADGPLDALLQRAQGI